MDKIGVFCSGCEPMHPLHVEAACRLGEWIGRTKRTLVYGGANLGLMECVARAVKENGGNSDRSGSLKTGGTWRSQ